MEARCCHQSGRSRSLVLAACALSMALGAACNPREFNRVRARVQEGGDGGRLQADAGFDAGAADAGSAPDDAIDAPRDAGLEASVEPSCPPMHAEDHVFRVRSAVQLGALPKPPSVKNRTLGASFKLGGKLLWTFPDVMLETPGELQRITVAQVNPDDLLAIEEIADDAGVPLPYLQREGDEAVPDSLWGLAPASIIPVSDEHALMFVLKAALFTPYFVLLADLRPDQLAQRRSESVFQGSGPFFYMGGFAHDEYVYLFSLQRGVARAPLEGASQPANYRTWNNEERAWVSDLSRQSPVLPEANNHFSVAYNRYLGRFLYVNSVSDENVIELRYADEPQGPYMRFASVETLPSATPERSTYAGREHVVLRSDCDRSLLLSYYLPLEVVNTELGYLPVRGEIQLMRIELE